MPAPKRALSSSASGLPPGAASRSVSSMWWPANRFLARWRSSATRVAATRTHALSGPRPEYSLTLASAPSSKRSQTSCSVSCTKSALRSMRAMAALATPRALAFEQAQRLWLRFGARAAQIEICRFARRFARRPMARARDCSAQRTHRSPTSRVATCVGLRETSVLQRLRCSLILDPMLSESRRDR